LQEQYIICVYSLFVYFVCISICSRDVRFVVIYVLKIKQMIHHLFWQNPSLLSFRGGMTVEYKFYIGINAYEIYTNFLLLGWCFMLIMWRKIML